MGFLKKHKDLILGAVAVFLLALLGFRIFLFVTLSPAEPGSFKSSMYETLGIEEAYVDPRPAREPEDLHWSFEGATGQFDVSAARRGLQVYRNVCSACHSLDYVAFRNLTDLGYSEAQAKSIAESYTITDGPDEFGEMYERPGELADYFPAPFPNEQAAAAANGGTAPPDLSVIAKARAGGPDYIYSLLTGYEAAPADFEPNSERTFYNPYFAGWEILMAQPLFEGMVEYPDGTEATVEQMARDVSHFLMWTAEPKLEERHRLGFQVTIYLLVLTALLFFSMRKIWRRLK